MKIKALDARPLALVAEANADGTVIVSLTSPGEPPITTTLTREEFGLFCSLGQAMVK